MGWSRVLVTGRPPPTAHGLELGRGGGCPPAASHQGLLLRSPESLTKLPGKALSCTFPPPRKSHPEASALVWKEVIEVGSDNTLKAKMSFLKGLVSMKHFI